MVVLLSREPRQVEDDDEVDLPFVGSAVLQQPLQLRSVGGLGTLAFLPESLENFISLTTTVLFASTELRWQAQILSLLLRADADVSDGADH